MAIDYDNKESTNDFDGLSIDTSDDLSEEKNPKILTFNIKVNVACNKLYTNLTSPVKKGLHREVHAIEQNSNI